MTPTFNNGEIWLARLNPNKGKEPGKTRPVLIFQAQALIDSGHTTTIILPLTTDLSNPKIAKALRVRIKAQDKLKKESDVLIDQIRSIDNSRFIGEALTKLNNELINTIRDAVSLATGITE